MAEIRGESTLSVQLGGGASLYQILQGDLYNVQLKGEKGLSLTTILMAEYNWVNITPTTWFLQYGNRFSTSLDGSIIYAAGYTTVPSSWKFFVSMNYGQSWTERDVSGMPIGALSTHLNNSNIVYRVNYGTTDANIHVSTDYGVTWTTNIIYGYQVYNKMWTSSTTPGTIIIHARYTATNTYHLLKSTDYGASWTSIRTPLSLYYSPYFSPNGNYGIAFNPGGSIWAKTTNGGSSWITMTNPPSSGDYKNLIISNNGEVYGANTSRAIQYSPDMGGTWTGVSINGSIAYTSNGAMGIEFGGDKMVLETVLGTPTKIYSSGDAGETFYQTFLEGDVTGTYIDAYMAPGGNVVYIQQQNPHKLWKGTLI